MTTVTTANHELSHAPILIQTSICKSLQMLIFYNPKSARVVCCVLQQCPAQCAFLKPSWLPSDHSRNGVTGRIAAVVCPKGPEPWEKSREAWPSNNTGDHWGSPGYGEFFGFFFFEWSGLIRLLASTQGVIKTESAFSIEGLPFSFSDLLLRACPNKHWWL